MRHRSPHARFVLGGSEPGQRPFRGMCCWPDCDQPPGIDDIPLCVRHHIKAWRTMNQSALRPLRDLSDDAIRRAMANYPRSRSTEQGYVYFARFGDRVKIGFTTNVKQRMGGIPHDQVLGAVPGTMADEKRCHAAFAHLRITGEWFEPGQDLMDFIAEVVKQHGTAELDNA